MKTGFFLLLLCLCMPLRAQAPLPPPAASAIPAQAPPSVSGLLAPSPEGTTAGASASGPVSPKSQAVASPAPVPTGETPLPGLDTDKADPNTSLILDNADTFSQNTAGVWTGQGHVKVRYQGYTLTSDRVDTDLDSGETTFSGGVVLKSPDGQTVQGGPDGVLHLNLRRGTYSVTGATTTVPANNVPIGIILPVFVTGGSISGQPGLIDARGSRFTTCDFLTPHYFFTAKSLHIRPGKRLTAHSVTLYRKNRRLFTLPYLVVPLDNAYQRQTLFPQVGQTPDEGYFIKFALGYAVLSQLPGILHVDLMQRKGVGTGFDQSYGPEANNGGNFNGFGSAGTAGRRGSGTISLYRLQDSATGLTNINGGLTHAQRFGTIDADLDAQLQQNSYYQGASKSSSLNSTLNLSRVVGNLTTGLRTNLQTSDYGSGGSRTVTSSFAGTFTPTQQETFSSNFDFSQYVSPGFLGVSGTDQQALTSNLDYKQTGHILDIELLGAKNSTLKGGSGSGIFGGGSTTFGGVERLPELRLATDAVRLSDLRAFLPRTTHLSLSLGMFRELTSLTPSEQERLRFGVDLGQNTRRFDSHNALDYGGTFQQGVYSDGGAQYVLNGRTGYRLSLGSKSSFGLAYAYLRPYGYTPFQFDYAGYSNLASAALLLQDNPALQLSLGTGFDFNRVHSAVAGLKPTPWQSISVQSLYSPGGGNILRLRTTTAYDLNHNTLLDVTNVLRVRGSGTTAFDLSARYSPFFHKFSSVSGDLDLPFLYDRNPQEQAGYRVRGIGGYNGLTRKFDYQGLALTRSWHDYEATLVYQNTPQGLRPGSTVTFNFRLKAFPDQEPFAVGQFGQPLDVGLGTVY